MSSLLEYWYDAKASPHGIVLETSDPETARQRLYAVKREAADPSLEGLSLRISRLHPQTELWIVKDAR